MSSVCAEQQHKLLLSLKKSLRDIDVDIPPRKLLLARRDAAGDMFSDEDPYSSDQFRMYEFKVRRCTRSRSHDWTDCPFAHPGEKARRRDPRRYQYSADMCPEYRRGNCGRGDACEFSHGVFECWLHPARYRTEACKDGKNCKRKVCFFAHTPRQLRVLPPQYLSCNSNNNNKSNNCCSFCHCSSSSATCSPTSTLFGVSHFASSPPLSPSSSSSSPTPSRFVGPDNNHHHHHGVSVVSSKPNELMCSLEGMRFGEAYHNSPVSASKLPWLDVSLSCEDQRHILSPPSAASSFGCEDHNQHRQQFVLSPAINSASFSNGKYYSTGRFLREESKVVDDVTAAPDLGWVNELLM